MLTMTADSLVDAITGGAPDEVEQLARTPLLTPESCSATTRSMLYTSIQGQDEPPGEKNGGDAPPDEDAQDDAKQHDEERGAVADPSRNSPTQGASEGASGPFPPSNCRAATTYPTYRPPCGSSAACFYGAFEEAPSFMQENPFILRGYRLQHTMFDCVLSWFGLHNETGNIWTHLVGALIVLVLMACYSPTIFHGSRELTPVHRLVWVFLVFGSVGCLLCSAIYHTFTCHSRGTSKFCRSIDYLGVNLLILGSCYPICYYLFACHPIARIVYPTVITVLGAPGLIGPFVPGFFDLRWEHPRTALYAGLAMSGIVPMIHGHVIIPFRGDNVIMFILLYAMYLSYGAGLFFYATKIPERFAPGRFDLFLQSHNLWHIFVVGGALIHFVNCYYIHCLWLSGRAQGFQC